MLLHLCLKGLVIELSFFQKSYCCAIRRAMKELVFIRMSGARNSIVALHPMMVRLARAISLLAGLGLVVVVYKPG